MRTTLRQVKEKLDEVNAKKKTDLRIFPNCHGYGISNFHKGVYVWPNVFNGSLRECYAFLKGMTYNIKENKQG